MAIQQAFLSPLPRSDGARRKASSTWRDAPSLVRGAGLSLLPVRPSHAVAGALERLLRTLILIRGRGPASAARQEERLHLGAGLHDGVVHLRRVRLRKVRHRVQAPTLMARARAYHDKVRDSREVAQLAQLG